jgi:hypothetical protein
VLGGVQAAEVLPRDRGVGADVDDVDPVGADAVEVSDGLRDDAAGDEGLPEPYLIGDEVAVCRVVVEVETAERRVEPWPAGSP